MWNMASLASPEGKRLLTALSAPYTGYQGQQPPVLQFMTRNKNYWSCKWATV